MNKYVVWAIGFLGFLTLIIGGKHYLAYKLNEYLDSRPYPNPDVYMEELMKRPDAETNPEIINEQRADREKWSRKNEFLKTHDFQDLAWLTVKSEPSGADIFLNSYLPVGKTPYEHPELAPGKYRVTLEKPGYYPKVKMVKLGVDDYKDVDFKLEPIPFAKLTLEIAQPDTTIKLIGLKEHYSPGMKLVPGDYIIAATHPEFGTRRLGFTAHDNETIEFAIDFEAASGSLRVEANCGQAVVYIDRQEAGRTPITISNLLPGPHTLEVWQSLYKPSKQQVAIKSGTEKTLQVNLAEMEHFTNDYGMTFVKIPAGSFMMGFRDDMVTETSKIRKTGGERKKYRLNPVLLGELCYPRHYVEISKPFYIQTTELTEEQYEAIMGRPWRWPEKTTNPNLPIEDTNGYNPYRVIPKLNRLDFSKYRYRLPTEAEWEYACRAGTTSPFYTGETISTDQANYKGDEPPYGSGKKGINRGGSLPVASFAPNPWGLYDMHGNVQEVCADDYQSRSNNYYTWSPIVDPEFSSDGRWGTVGLERGGAWDLPPEDANSASRCPNGVRGHSVGIRLVAEPRSPK